MSSSNFADAVLQLLKNDKRRLEMGQEGKKKADKLFKWDLIATKYEEVLKAASSRNNTSI